MTSAEEGSGEPRRFDVGMLVDSEIIGSFINRSFLDPDDDRVLDEMLNHEVGAGLRVRDLGVTKEQLRETLRQKQAAGGVWILRHCRFSRRLGVCRRESA